MLLELKAVTMLFNGNKPVNSSLMWLVVENVPGIEFQVVFTLLHQGQF